MKFYHLLSFCLLILSCQLTAQEPGIPTSAQIIKEDDVLFKEIEQKKKTSKRPIGEEIKGSTTKSSAGTKKTGDYIVLLEDDVIPPFSTKKSKFSSRESQADAADKHYAAAEKAIRKLAMENYGVSNDEIDQIYVGLQSGFSVKLANKKSASSWFTKAKSKKVKAQVFEDFTFEPASHATEAIVDADDPTASRFQYADYSNWAAGGCNCEGHQRFFWVLDSGIDLDHPDLNVKTRYMKSFFRDESPDDFRGHGTHVAGIAAAKNNHFGAKGIAAGAWVVPVKVMNRRGWASASTIVAGLNWVYRYGVAGDIVMLNYGAHVHPMFQNLSNNMERNIKKLASHGIYVVMSAGNDRKSARFKTPAKLNGSKIYTITATTAQPKWYEFNFARNYANYGKPPVDYAAPGSSIYSTFKNRGYAYSSGTSMAASNFAGVLMCGLKRRKGYRYYSVRPSSHKLYVLRVR